MPVPEALRRLSEDPGFWAALRQHSAHPDKPLLPAELRVSFPVSAGYGLVLDLDLTAGEVFLGLREPRTSEPVQLGWAAAGHPYPAALRWWELDLCARVIALDDPTLPHPGLVVALLSPFAPATDDDDPAAIAAVREAAYRSLRRTEPLLAPGPPVDPDSPDRRTEPPRAPSPRGRAPSPGDQAPSPRGQAPDSWNQAPSPGDRTPDPWDRASGLGHGADQPADPQRSDRRTTPPVQTGPEQAPLPLFADDRWWPQPPVRSPQVLDEAAIAAWTRPAPAGVEVRCGSRFPRAGVAQLVRHAADRLARIGREPWYPEVQPLAHAIAATGDLDPVGLLVGALTEAGCDHPTVLDALSEPLVPVEACWMVETLAGAQPGTLLRHHV